MAIVDDYCFNIMGINITAKKNVQHCQQKGHFHPLKYQNIIHPTTTAVEFSKYSQQG